MKINIYLGKQPLVVQAQYSRVVKVNKQTKTSLIQQIFPAFSSSCSFSFSGFNSTFFHFGFLTHISGNIYITRTGLDQVQDGVGNVLCIETWMEFTDRRD